MRLFRVMRNVTALFHSSCLVFLLALLPCFSAAAGTITVNTNADNTTEDSFITLREAIMISNGGTGALGRPLTAGELALISGSVGAGIADNIVFGGAYTILLNFALPDITDANTVINGYTVSGTVVNTTSASSLLAGLDMIVKVRLMGDGGVENGISIDANGCVVRGLSITNFVGSGIIWLSGSVHTSGKVEGCYLGLTPAGAAAANNYGVTILSNNAHIQIGGTTPAARNLISGNSTAGIFIDGGAFCTIAGNFIGTAASGMDDLGNAFNGILFDGVSVSDTVGGATPNHRNLISGNNLHGIFINSEGSDYTVIRGNFIGLGRDGEKNLKNLGNGIRVDGGADNTLIGGDWKSNYICYNAVGIYINASTTTLTTIATNFIGIDLAGDPAGNIGDGIHLDQAVTTMIGPLNRIGANTESGIVLIAGDATTIRGNFIGTDSTLASPDFANGDHGIAVLGAAANNLIGGPAAADRNIIVHNYNYGIEISEGSAANTVQNNFIGVARDGATAAGNGSSGIGIINANVNTIGPGNIISGNFGCGVLIFGGGCHDNAITGNLIGTKAGGTASLANLLDGVRIENINVPDAVDNMVGGDLPSDRNVIAGNKRCGVRLTGPGVTLNGVMSNYIGLAQGGRAALKNDSSGIRIENGAHGNILGSPTLIGTGNVVSGNGAGGIVVHGAGSEDNEIYGNFVGLTAAGDSAIANSGNGILLTGGAFGTIIGKNTIASRNVLSGNAQNGILIDSVSGAFVRGNYIGTNAAGAAALPNAGSGILVRTADNIIGGETGGFRNIISGNAQNGIAISGSDASGTRIYDNWIGQNVSGAPLGNGADGVWIGNGAAGTFTGGTTGSRPNVIRDNGGRGVALNASAGLKNLISGNSIFHNAGLGIDIDPLGAVNTNDANDADEGPNRKMNFPSITYANWDTLSRTLTVKVQHNATTARAKYPITVEFFTGGADSTGNGEGQIYLGTGTIASPSTVTTVNLLNVNPRPAFLTCVAIDGDNNTSEFSRNFVVTVPVELSLFVATRAREGVILRWRTESETNNRGFDIERAEDPSGAPAGANRWNSIGFAAGQGTSLLPRDYAFTDRTAGGGRYFYRLVQIDFDGSATTSPVVEADLRDASLFLEQSYPNPAHSGAFPVTIAFTLPAAGAPQQARLVLQDALGRVIRVLAEGALQEGRHEIRIPSGALPPGMYFYQLTAGGINEIRRLIVE